MIEIFKINNGIYDRNTTQVLMLSKDMAPRTRHQGNSHKVVIRKDTWNTWNYSFATNFAGIWNYLSEKVVNAPNIEEEFLSWKPTLSYAK